jgi:plastocyanin
MTWKNVRIAFASVSIVVLTLFLTSSKLKATDQPATRAAEVNIDNFSFGPDTINVPVGATVTWKNRDVIPHTVVSTDGVFKSKVRDTDETFSYTFSKAGIYSYFCSIHPKMVGKVIVR